jgi:hypothetical protein
MRGIVPSRPGIAVIGASKLARTHHAVAVSTASRRADRSPSADPGRRFDAFDSAKALPARLRPDCGHACAMQSGNALKVMRASRQYHRAMRIPGGSVREYVPCRPKRQPPPG